MFPPNGILANLGFLIGFATRDGGGSPETAFVVLL